MGDDVREFGGFAGIRQGKDGIARYDHAQVVPLLVLFRELREERFHALKCFSFSQLVTLCQLGGREAFIPEKELKRGRLIRLANLNAHLSMAESLG